MKEQLTTATQALSPEVLGFCEKAARHWELDLNSAADRKKIATQVLRLSDYFIAAPEAPTPWRELWAQQAYVFYFLPLNSLRLARVLDHIRPRLAELPVRRLIDFGAGLATLSRFFLESPWHLQLIERAREPRALVDLFDIRASAYHWQDRAPNATEIAEALTCFSYSLTELTELPDWARNSPALLLVEPSTQQDGRRLMLLREKLLREDYHLLAPCPHQAPCPLLHQSKTDWCHDRVLTQLPAWLEELEDFLPMKNRSLTFSYLFAVKKSALTTEPEPTPSARLVGDLLREKGKDRQLVCRGPAREFLTWMHKQGPHEELPRGELVQLPKDLRPVANELRIGPTPVRRR